MDITRRGLLSHLTIAAASGLMPTVCRGAAFAPNATTFTGIGRAVRRDETIIRHAVSGDIFPITWVDDNRQFVSLSDGMGPEFSALTPINTQGCWMIGERSSAKFSLVPSYPTVFNPRELGKSPLRSRYYGIGVLAVDGHIYQTLGTWDRPYAFEQDAEGPVWIGTKLIYSPDYGRTWCNQNGSSSVEWEQWEDRSSENMMFFREPQDSFSLVTFLQMGRNYSLNRDGYVYGYAPNGHSDGTMNELVMFRVAKTKLRDRDSYEYFAGLQSNEKARWSSDIHSRKPVHVFQRGWVNSRRFGSGLVQAWVPSVAYNAPLGLYMMVAAGIGLGAKGEAFGKPSYLGVWVSREPWGPWTQVAEETAWTPQADINARCYSPQISPKWISEDGRSFWLVWSDFKRTCSRDVLSHRAELEDKITDATAWSKFRSDSWRMCKPNYVFNMQRVDLM